MPGLGASWHEHARKADESIGRQPHISSPKATQNPWKPTATGAICLLRQALQPRQIILIARRL